MSRMKTFFKYFLIFLAVYILVDICSFRIVMSTYKSKDVGIDSNIGNIEILESKATFTNGYIRGKFTNNTGSNLVDKLLKIDLFSKRGKNLGIKYIDLGNLANGESKDFETRYNIDNVDNIKMSVIDKNSVEDLDSLDFSIDDIKLDKFPWYVYLAAVIMLL